ncbi:hypothetical protein ONZ45_g8620 [Pleurotus djamor]|nr:hypothetical protein ONZ45_g8620 [Pleurotus djamor]
MGSPSSSDPIQDTQDVPWHPTRQNSEITVVAFQSPSSPIGGDAPTTDLVPGQRHVGSLSTSQAKQLADEAQAIKAIASDPKGFVREYVRLKLEALYQRTFGVWIDKTKFLVVGWIFSVVNGALSRMGSSPLDVKELQEMNWDLEEYLDAHAASSGFDTGADGPESAHSSPPQGTVYNSISLTPRNDPALHQATKLFLAQVTEVLILVQQVIPQFILLAQEHAIHLAPVISVGHLSTTALAATTIAMMITSITGWSVIKGVSHALDLTLAKVDPKLVLPPEEDSEQNVPKTPSSCDDENSPLLGSTASSCTSQFKKFPTPPPLLSAISETSTLVATPIESSKPFPLASTSTLVSQELNSTEDVQMCVAAKQCYAHAALVMAAIIPPIISLWLSPKPLFDLLDVQVNSIVGSNVIQATFQDMEVVKLATEYLQVSALGIPAYGFNEIFKRYLNSRGYSSIHASVLTFLTPVVMLLNYLLVDGPVEKFKLGFVAAPAITAFSHNFTAFMMVLIYASLRVPFLLKNTLKGVVISAAELWSKDAIAIVASMLGSTSLAAQSVLAGTVSTAYLVPKSINSVSGARLEKWAQRKDMFRLRIAATIGLLFTVVGVFVTGNLVLASSSSLGNLFTSDEAVVQVASGVLPIIVMYLIPQGLSTWTQAVMASLGYKMILSSLATSMDYCAGIPVGLYLIFKHHFGIGGLWLGLTLSYACTALVGVVVLANRLNAAKHQHGTPRRWN